MQFFLFLLFFLSRIVDYCHRNDILKVMLNLMKIQHNFKINPILNMMPHFSGSFWHVKHILAWACMSKDQTRINFVVYFYVCQELDQRIEWNIKWQQKDIFRSFFIVSPILYIAYIYIYKCMSIWLWFNTPSGSFWK